MELIQTDQNYIFMQIQSSDTALWCSRETGYFSIHPSWDLASESNPECLGTIIGLLGKIRLHPSLDEILVVIKESDRVGELPESDLSKSNPIYRIRTVVLIPLTQHQPNQQQLHLKPCPKHHSGKIDLSEVAEGYSANGGTANVPAAPGKFNLRALSGKIKTAGSSLKSTANTATAGLANQVKAPWKKRNGGEVLERLERRLHEELLRLFNDSGSFYFMLRGDLTNSMQRQYSDLESRPGDPVYIRADERFFFNKCMLQEIIDLEDSRAEPWILPVIQGFVEIKECSLNEDYVEELQMQPESRLPHFYTLIVISRRSRHRAGTRYKRRGVDEMGHVANFVETEQILLYHTYALSFVQVRGSIPVYWSQPGIKYRPPPRLHKDETENQEAFSNHFQSIFDRYGGCVNCISLVDRAGREKVLADGFLENILIYNHPQLAYISFDFHEHCRGMRFENVSILLDTVDDLINETGYFWVDPHGVVTRQNGVFRINCVDCLDRTNVVQTAIARRVLEKQLAKLGVVQPEMGLCSSEQTIFQWIWANNGDSISKQYAGTNALKGDFTRTGERNLSGLVKDGVNSASRYYLNHIKDTYRQAAIDLVLGSGISDEMLAQVDQDRPLAAAEPDPAAALDHVRTVIEDCKKMLMHDTSNVIGSWGLIDADPVTGDPAEDGVDVVFILTPESYYTARYDEDLDQIFEYQQVPLTDIIKIEFGVLEQSFNLTGLLNNKSKEEHCFRIHYRIGDQTGFFHMFRSTNLKFFNNTVEPITSEEDKIESLKGIADSVAVSIESIGLVPDLWFGPLEKKKSKPLDPNTGDTFKTRRLRQAGSQAINTVTSNLSKLNPMNKFMRPGSAKEPSSGSPVRFTDLQKTAEVEQPIVNQPGSDYQSLPTQLTGHLDAGHLTYQATSHEPNQAAVYRPEQAAGHVTYQATSHVPNQAASYMYQQAAGHVTHQTAGSALMAEQPSIKLDLAADDIHTQYVHHLAPGTSPGQHRRKISKSTEDLTNKMENVLMPFAKLTQGLSVLGNNLDNQLSKSCEQIVGREPGGGGSGHAPTGVSPMIVTAPRQLPTQPCFSNIDERVTRGDSGCRSLILNI